SVLPTAVGPTSTNKGAGLLRNSIFKPDNLHRLRTRLTADSNDINPPIAVQFGVLLQIVLRRLKQVGAFLRGDGFLGQAKVCTGTGFDFNYNQHLAIPGKQIQLAIGGTDVAGDNGESVLHKMV